jgi:acetate kinase
LDTLVFTGGVGKNAPCVRSRICEGLGHLGIEIDEKRNAAGDAVISTDASRTTVRVIRTDEDLMIARSVSHILKTDTVNKGLIHENRHTHA